MNIVRKLSFVVLVLTIAALSVTPALADNTISKTFTEEQINASYRVTNPYRRSLTNVDVDLQPEQVVISATHTTRQHSVDTVTTIVPLLENGRVYWEVVSIVTADGQAASADLVAQVNASIMTSWRNYIRGKVDGILTDITITDTDITFTGVLEERIDNAVENGAVTDETTPRLWNWWNRRNGN